MQTRCTEQSTLTHGTCIHEKKNRFIRNEYQTENNVKYFCFPLQLRRATSVKLANEQTYCAVCLCVPARGKRKMLLSQPPNKLANKPTKNNWTNITANRSGVQMNLTECSFPLFATNENTYQVQQLIKRSKWFKFESFSVCISTCGRCQHWHRRSLSGSLQMQISYSPPNRALAFSRHGFFQLLFLTR